MKFIFILLFNLLFLNVYCIYIIGKAQEFTITNLSETVIIYIKLDKFSNAENIYVKLEIDKGEINDYDFEKLFKFLLDYS